MYISTILLTGPYAGNRYEYHRAVWTLFGSSEKRPFLFKVEEENEKSAVLLIQSAVEPKDPSNKNVTLLKCVAFTFPPIGAKERFVLVANPVKTIKDRFTAKHCRVPLSPRDYYLWLEKRLSKCAKIIELKTEMQPPFEFNKSPDLVGKIQPVLFEGLIEVTDSDTFKTVAACGLGPAKAFGCGMITITHRSHDDI